MTIPGVSGQQTLPPWDHAFRTKISSWLPTAQTPKRNNFCSLQTVKLTGRDFIFVKKSLLSLPTTKIVYISV